MIEVEQHDHAGLGIEARERNEADPHGHAQVIAEQVEHPKCTYQRERNGEQHDNRLRDGLRVHVDENENDEQRERDDDFEPGFRGFEILELPCPLDVIAGRELHPFADALGGGFDVARDVVGGNVHKDEPDELRVFVADGRRAGLIADVRKQGDGHLRAGGGRHQHPLESVEVFPEIAGVADVDRITFAPLDGRSDGLAADGALDDVVHVADAQTVARRGFAIHVEVEEVTAGGALGEDAAGVRKITERVLDLLPRFFRSP